MAKVKNPFSSERTILGYSGRGIAAALRVAIPLLTSEQPAPSGVMVRSQIIKANGEPVNVDCMMRRTGDSWLISDIYLDGAISEVATRRSEFATILKSQGIDGLIWSRAARRSKEVGFAMDSPLEGDGFEPSVPLYILTVSDPLLVGPVTVPFAKRKSPVRDRVPSVRRLLPPPSVPDHRLGALGWRVARGGVISLRPHAVRAHRLDYKNPTG